MKQKKEPRHGWATVCGAKTRQDTANYSAVAASRQEMIDHRWWPAGVFPPVVTGGEPWQESFLTSIPQADNLRVLKQERCVDLHPKPGLFLFPTIEFASSVRVSARPWEPFLALGTLGAFLFGGIHHE